MYAMEAVEVCFTTIVTTAYVGATQFPPEHLQPEGQAFVQLPQWEGSCAVSTHADTAAKEAVHRV